VIVKRARIEPNAAAGSAKRPSATNTRYSRILPQVVKVYATRNTHMHVITCLSYDLPTLSVDRLIG
jgi:hypothetical protein